MRQSFVQKEISGSRFGFAWEGSVGVKTFGCYGLSPRLLVRDDQLVQHCGFIVAQCAQVVFKTSHANTLYWYPSLRIMAMSSIMQFPLKIYLQLQRFVDHLVWHPHADWNSIDESISTLKASTALLPKRRQSFLIKSTKCVSGVRQLLHIPTSLSNVSLLYDLWFYSIYSLASRKF